MPRGNSLVNEHMFRSLAESATVLIWVSGADGQCTWFNPAWLRFTGRSLVQEAGTGWLDGVHPDDREACLATYQQAFSARTSFEMEYRLRHVSGEYRWIVDNGAPRLDPEGVFLGYAGACWDVTERRAAAQDLHRQEQLLRTIYDTSTVAICLVDPNGRLAHANQRMADMFRCTLDDLIGTRYVDHVHPCEREIARRNMQSLLASRVDHVSLERLYLRHDGTHFCGLLSGRSMVSENGELLFGLVGTIADITQAKEAEAERRLAASVFDASHEGILITDAQNRILSINRAFSRITGYAADEVLGRTPGILSSGRHPHAFYQQMWDALHEVGHWEGEIWNRHRDGHVYPEWLAINTVLSDTGQIVNFIGMFSDITERKEAEARIHQLAYYDPLTRLPNRALFFDRAQQVLATARRRAGHCAILFLDLDRFKPINDVHGHDVGDAVLREVALRIQRAVRETDSVSRQGGDEFLVLVGDFDDTAILTGLAHRLVDTVAMPCQVGSLQLTVGVSIGIAVYPEDGEDIDALLRAADLAMYRAKTAGTNQVCCYTSA